MKTLIIAEKHSVMSKIAQSIGKNVNYSKGYAEDNNFIFTHCVGHLLVLKLPAEIDEKYKKWSINTLPFVFDKIPLKVSDSVKDQFNVVKKLLERDDISEVVNACDADREGELIFRNLYYFSKCKCKNVSRMWIETIGSKSALVSCFEARKPASLYDNLYQAALARQYADYHIGLNSTIAMSSVFGNGTVLSIGRVQTPTLRIIVDLEKQIKNFVSKPFWKIVAHTDENVDGQYVDKTLDDNRFDSKSDCQTVIDKTGVGPATVTDVIVSTRQDSPRLLYNLSDLQVDMNKRYKYSAQTVLDACQSLYERHGLTTYPRTSENHISPEFASKVDMIVKGLPSSLFDRQKRQIVDNKFTFNKKMIAKKDGIGAHEALTPVPEASISEEKIQNLSIIELNVYKAITERFLAAFYPDAIFEKQEITFERNGSVFKNKVENLVFNGHYDAYSVFKEKAKEEFVKINKGDILNINELEMVEGATVPPSRLTEGALLKIMTNPSKYVVDKEEKAILEQTEGIGTEATRASIIEELKRREYVELQKDKLIPTEKGIALIEIIPTEEIKSVSLTAQLEKKLSLIAKGEYERDVFLNEANAMEKSFIDKIKNVKTDYVFESGNDESKKYKEKKSICTCPNCKSDIMEGPYGFYCTNKECKVSISYTAFQRFNFKKIGVTQAKDLLTLGKTKKSVELTNKAGKKYKAFLLYKFDLNAQYPNTTSIEFDDSDNKKKK